MASPNAGKPSQLRLPMILMGSTLRSKEIRFAFLLVFPALLIVGGMYLYPSILTVLFSFSKVDLATLSISELVGIENYRRLLADPMFRATIWRSLYFAFVIVFVTISLAFWIALLLNQKFFGRDIIRTTILLPWAIPPVVAGVLWGQIFHAEAGILNAIIYQLGLGSGTYAWMSDSTIALHVIIMAEIWRFLPFVTLFVLAGIQNIPSSLYDAANMDGAGKWKQFWHVTLPLTMPVLLPVSIVQLTWAMKSFDTIFVLTGGMEGTRILNYFVYMEAFRYFSLGPASAAAYILLLIKLAAIMAFTLLQRKFIRGGVAR